jgi:dihydroorotase
LIVDLVLKDAKAYIGSDIVHCCLAIDDGKIFKIGRETNMPKADHRIDLGRLLVLPGLIDAHVHLRDEGKSYKEDFYSGTAAAAAGGVTTVLDMPNNNPVTMSAETLRNRMHLAENKILVNTGFYSEFPNELNEVRKIVDEGAVAFKLFMADQIGGLNADDENGLQAAFEEAGRLKFSVAVHAEDKTLLRKIEEELKRANHNDVDAFLKAHSELIEVKAIDRAINASKQTNVHVHFCHVSTENGLNHIVDAKKKGLPITSEVTPHHLLLSTSDFRRCGSLALTMPPIREKRHSEALWNGVSNGWIDILGSDHAPHTLEEKTANSIWNVKVGIPGLETTLPLLLSNVKKSKLSIGDVVRLLSEKPAEIFNLKGRGKLKEGNHADLVAVDLRREYKIDASNFHSKAKYSPFDGWMVEGEPVKTFVNGQLIMDEGEIVAKAGSGEIVRRERF